MANPYRSLWSFLYKAFDFVMSPEFPNLFSRTVFRDHAPNFRRVKTVGFNIRKDVLGEIMVSEIHSAITVRCHPAIDWICEYSPATKSHECFLWCILSHYLSDQWRAS